jgi:hypothetical protein
MTDLTLSEILPNTVNGLNGTGFLFGAGTSVCAGYPIMASLTQQVVEQLKPTERSQLDQALGAGNETYDPHTGQPNIERIVDSVISYAIDSGSAVFATLEDRLRRLVTESILAVHSPDITEHVRFFEALKARAYGKQCCVYIFTTNYDILFELAATQAGVALETGFTGSVDRFFDPERFSEDCGRVSSGRFNAHPVLTIRLIKLHGSISWTMHSSRIFERHPDAVAAGLSRVMILPQRRKVLETLQPPYDTLFGLASRIIGRECKYIASCGFSFGDDHINQTLISPGMATRSFRLFTLCQHEPEGIAGFRGVPAFHAGFQDSGITGGVTHYRPTSNWKFTEFINLFR